MKEAVESSNHVLSLGRQNVFRLRVIVNDKGCGFKRGLDCGINLHRRSLGESYFVVLRVGSLLDGRRLQDTAAETNADEFLERFLDGPLTLVHVAVLGVPQTKVVKKFLRAPFVPAPVKQHE